MQNINDIEEKKVRNNEFECPLQVTVRWNHYECALALLDKINYG